MNLSNNCQEKFLEGVIDVYIYSIAEVKLPIPFNVAQIMSMSVYTFGYDVLHIATSGEAYVVAESITAKTTLTESGNGTLYTFNISGSVENGQNYVCEAVKTLRRTDYFIVLKTQGGTRYLVNTLPNTFSFRSTDSKSLNEDSRDFTISAKAMSDFIRLE